MKQLLIILRGAPASGKSSIARSLRNFEKRVVWLKVDNFKPFFAEDASEALNYVNGSALATLDYLLTNGFSVVMDGVFQNPDCVENALVLAESKHISAYAFDLQCSLETLIERDKNRTEVLTGHREQMNNVVLKKIHDTLRKNPIKSGKVFSVEELSLNKCIVHFQKLLN